MLVEFRVKNFKSIKDEQTLSMVASSDSELKHNVFNVNKLRLLNSAAIYGPNASGKSNIILAMDFMRDLVLESTKDKPGDEIEIQPFFLDRKSKKMPSAFEVIFFIKGIRYQYGFSLTRKMILGEWLYAFPKNTSQLWFRREYDGTSKSYTTKYGSYLKGEKKLLEQKTRDNVLFLSVGAYWNNIQLKQVYEWFHNNLRVKPSRAKWFPITARLLHSLENDSKINSIINDFLKRADLGICGVKIKKKAVEDAMIPKNLPKNIKKAFMNTFSEITKEVSENVLFEALGQKAYDIQLIHENFETGHKIPFSMADESDGTIQFFQFIGPWIEAAILGITAFIDEIENSLHSLLTRELIEKFQKNEFGEAHSQLVFTTHDTTLLDPTLFRRDQIWFTEKDKKGATRLFPLSDFKPRKDEALQKGYLSGRYGALPILERFK